MGYMRHHAILVTDYGHGIAIEVAHAKAVSFGILVSPIAEPTTNGIRSFACFPDGSKEGWPESDVGDVQRKAMVEQLRSQYYGDGSSPLSWVEVQYGDDERETKIIDSSDDDRRAHTKREA